MFGALLQWFDGPLKIFEKIGIVTYRLKLLEHMRAHHSIFHRSLLKPCRIDEGDSSRVASSRGPALIPYKIELEVKEILAHRTSYFEKNIRHRYFVYWKGKLEDKRSCKRKDVFW